MQLTRRKFQEGWLPTAVAESVLRVEHEYRFAPALAIISRAEHPYTEFPLFAIRLRRTRIISHYDCAVGQLHQVGHGDRHTVCAADQQLGGAPLRAVIGTETHQHAAATFGHSHQPAILQLCDTGIGTRREHFSLGIDIPVDARPFIWFVIFGRQRKRAAGRCKQAKCE